MARQRRMTDAAWRRRVHASKQWLAPVKHDLDMVEVVLPCMFAHSLSPYTAITSL